MKSLYIAALLAASMLSAARADVLLVEPGTAKSMTDAVVQKCAAGCIVLDGRDLAMLEKQVAEMAQKAFEAGIAAAKQAAKNAV